MTFINCKSSFNWQYPFLPPLSPPLCLSVCLLGGGFSLMLWWPYKGSFSGARFFSAFFLNSKASELPNKAHIGNNMPPAALVLYSKMIVRQRAGGLHGPLTVKLHESRWRNPFLYASVRDWIRRIMRALLENVKSSTYVTLPYDRTPLVQWASEHELYWSVKWDWPFDSWRQLSNSRIMYVESAIHGLLLWPPSPSSLYIWLTLFNRVGTMHRKPLKPSEKTKLDLRDMAKQTNQNDV